MESDFAAQYYAVRTQEGRVYDDATLAKLPEISASHPLAKEWAIRRHSLNLLMDHLRSLPHGQRILEIGCGNGWMSRHLATLPTVEIIAVDRVEDELNQARRVFPLDNLHFLNVDIFGPELELERFDLIIMAASAQYFPDFEKLILRLRELRKPGAAIHLLDTPFYEAGEVPAAIARTREYYEKMGHPALAADYYHHLWRDAERLGGELLYDPRTWWSRMQRKLGRPLSPFPWLRFQVD